MSSSALSLWSLEGPAVQTLPEGAVASAVELLPPTGSTFVARLNGAAMTAEYGMLEQFNNAFKFPVYFGWNGNALYDCLRDLSWCPADRYLTVIENAGSMLADDEDLRDYLLETLERASARWAIPHDKPNGEGIPFRTLLIG